MQPCVHSFTSLELLWNRPRYIPPTIAASRTGAISLQPVVSSSRDGCGTVQSQGPQCFRYTTASDGTASQFTFQLFDAFHGVGGLMTTFRV